MADPIFTSPAADATLDGTIQTFRWELGELPTQSAWLYIGATVGGSQYLTRFVGTASATSAGNLPTDGSAVHGRLWYQRDGIWNFVDRRWVAATTAGLPMLQAPPPGATLAGDTETFRWDFGPLEVQASWLYLGSAPAGSDLAVLPTGTDRQVTVTGLPIDDRTIHARLYFLVAGLWYHIDETYQAASDPGPTRDELIRELQTLVGVTADGIIGPVTRGALNQNWVARAESFDPSFAERFTGGDDLVSWVQRRLVARGADLVVDGDFGPVTEAATVADLGRGGVVAAESYQSLLDPAT